MKTSTILIPILLLFALVGDCTARSISVGSKKFTENVILGEITFLLAVSRGIPAEHRRELGGTRILWNALLEGDIDVYPEYTGTIVEEILHDLEISHDGALEKALLRYGIGRTSSLGFNNTYALGMRRDLAEKLAIRTISDLKLHPDLKIGFTNEFLDRRDGWPGLRRHYSLTHTNVRGLDHDLAYRGLESGSIQVIDLYSTDAEIALYDLITLEDDAGFFPAYDAVLLYRLDLEKEVPGFIDLLKSMEGKIRAPEMIAMNARAKIDHIPESRIAADFLDEKMEIPVNPEIDGFGTRLYRTTLDHLLLVCASLSAAILFAVPLGITAAKHRRTGRLILGFTGVIQTIPSLALLVFMIPLFGIGGPPAVIALFLYSLLPIVRNTHSGLHDIPLPIRESAIALGLAATTRLFRIELPLAGRSILAGIKTSAVINVGTATLGALIGAGGYGQPILTGIRLNDTRLILEGAVPAAILALLVQGVFDLAERRIIPKGLRLDSNKRSDS